MKPKSKTFRKKWGIFKSSFSFLVLLCLTTPLQANALSPHSLRGEGLVTLHYKKKIFRFHQAAVITNPSEATFEGFDDFGNKLFRIDLDGNRGTFRFKKRLAISFSSHDFVSFLLYRLPENADGLTVSYDRLGRMVRVEKKGTSKKAYQILYSDFMKKGKIIYPKVINVSSKKTNLTIAWQHLEIK